MKNTLVELNGLAEKMVGENPKAITDAQAISFIKEKYEGGQPSPTPTSKFDYIIPEISLSGYSDDVTISDSDTIAILNEIKTNASNELNICLHLYMDEDETHHTINIIDYDNREGWLYGFVNAGVWLQISITYYSSEWHCTSSQLIS